MPLPSLQYYDDLYNKRKANKPVAQIDGLDREIARMRSNEIKENLFLSASPDTVARVNRIARETGELPLLVEDRINDYEKSLVNSKFMQVADDNPGIAKWAVNNPRAAAAAADDAFSLAKFGAAFSKLKDDFAKDGGWLEQGGDFIERRAHGLLSGFDRFTVATERFFENLTPPAQRSEAAKRNTQVVVSKARQRAEFGEAVQALPIRNEILWQEVKKNPNASNIATFIRQQGFASIPDMALAVASLPLYTAGRSGETGQERAKNNNRSEATFGDVATAAPFAALSGYLDRLGFTKMVMPGSGTVVGRIGGAVVTEGATEFAQEIIDYGGATLGTEAGFQFSQALDAGVAGAVAGAGIGGTVRTTVESPQIVRALSSAVSNAMKGDAAKAEGAFLDELAKATEGSKLKERDTEAFREMIRSLADENDIKTVYISGEALQEYMQSESFDAEGPLSRWTAEVEEAAALGGDVVMPIEEAMAVLPGTPAWQALRDDMRLSPGGISRKEAQTFDEAMADVMDELARTMAEQEKATARKLEPIEKLSQSIAQKLQNVGFTPSAADTQARLLVQRYATRAERLGRELTGDEFGVTINQVLPEGIAQARAADNLDLVINSYFTMKKPKEQTGKSLVEWIVSRGGITDEGGDLAAMGLGEWHKQKAFRKKAIRTFDKNQGNMLGAVSNDYSPNRVLEAAIEEGYFPELQGTEDALDMNALLTAIEEELQGKPRYAQERIVDDIQQLASQLDEYLSQAGYDPANMTREEMRAAIESTQDAQLGGEVFEGAAAIEQEWDSIQGGEVVAFEDASGIRIEVKRTGPNTYEVSSLGGFQKLSEEQLKDNAREQNYIATAESKEEARKRNIAFGKRKYQVMQEVKALAEDIGAPDGFVRGYEKALSGEPMPQSYLDEAGAPYREGYERAVADGKAGTLSNTGPAREARQSTGQTYTQATITIDGVERPTRNSNGQPLAQTEEGVRNFWNWFGDSKVVDAQGRPLVVYHGTAGKIDVFNGMTWGAQDKALAREYAAMRSDMRKQDAEVMPIYMKAGRIFDADALPKTVRIGPFFNEALEQAQANGQEIDIERAKALLDIIRAARVREESGPDYSRHDFWNETVSLFGRDGAAAIEEMFELLGFDGVQMRESATYGKPGDPTYGVFSPEQIKSVNNRGTFDPADARILFQAAAPQESAAFKEWAGTDAPVIEPDEINDFDFTGEGPFVMRVFHGTTHEFEAFNASLRGNKEGQFGAVNYFTSSKLDADANYAGEGPDLTMRIERRAEELVVEIEDRFAEEGRKEVLQQYYNQTGVLRFVSAKVADMDDTDAAFEAARLLARRELAGGTEQTLEVFVRTEKPFIVGSEDSPWIEFTDFEALERQAIERVAENEGVDVSEVEAKRDDYEDAIDEARWEIESETPNALYEAVEAVASRYDLDPQEIYGQLADTTAIEGTKHNRLEDILRQTEALQYAEDPETGDLISNQVLAEIIEELGFDSIIMKNADVRFKTMKMDRGTAHVHVFDKHNSNIKAVDNRGTFDRNDSRILFQSAYHGSPHIFDKFSLDAIGTGEGAQVYGAGLYFSGSKEIADFYRRTLAGGDNIRITATYQGKSSNDWLADAFTDNGVVDDVADVAQSIIAVEDELMRNRHIDYQNQPGKTFDILQRQLDVAVDKLLNRPSTSPEMAAVLEKMQGRLTANAVRETRGRLYSVEIPEDSEFLLYDKAMDEQTQQVRKGIKKALKRIGSSEKEVAEILRDDGDFSKVTGERLYDKITDLMAYGDTARSVFGELGLIMRADIAASKLLNEAGVVGTKYLDGNSRQSGDGTYNYVVYDDSRVSIQAYEQSYGEGPRGRITFSSGQATIDLFQNRNLSTFLHEVGHLWLEELRFDAEMPDAPDQLKDDWQKVQDWFASQGHKVDGAIPVEAHEMWARGVERYLMEGKAPNSALKRVFETFRAWLTAIYKVVDALKSPITPEIRGVMDRLIATDEQLQDYAEQQRIAALFKTAAEAGMTGAEFAEYQRQTEEARTEANSKLIDKTMRVIRARETKRYKEAEATVREEITADVDARPMFKALRLLKTSPMDEKWIRSEMGEDSLSLLPRRVPPAYKAGGVHPDVIAEQSGFASGKAMVEALMGAEIAHRQAVEGGDQRSMRERTIAGEVDAIMQARYGDPLNDGTIEREALEAVHNEMQGEVIAAEIRVLARRTGRRPTPYAIARDWARNKIRQGVVSVEASPSAIQRYARAAAKAATKAQEAMLAQDVEEAFRQKQAQMVNNALVAEAKAAADEVEKAVKRMEKIAKRKTIKSVDQEYLEQAQALLENVDLRRRSQVGINRQNKFEAWAQEQQAAGHDVPVPPSFEQTLGKTNWTRLSVENLLSLDETIKHIMHLGRLKQTLLDSKERRDFDELVKEALDSAGNLRQKPPSDLMAPSYWDGIKSKILAADAALLKMETVFDWLDGNNPNGVFNRIVFRPIADAQEAERLKLQEYIEKLTDALKAVPKEVLSRWGDKVTTGLLNRETGRPFIFTRDMLVSMALNVGNQSNLDKLAGGYGWNEGEILATLASNLTEAEWQYVQSVWDTIDTLWPEIEAMEKRINGVAPEKIEARPVETPFGTLRGGYFPVVYDPARNYDAEANAAKGRDLFETIYTRATTPKGFTKERTNVERPIHLSLGIINRHVAEVIHDLTHREAIMQADKFLSDKRVMKAVDDTLGPEVRRQFRPWLQRIANEWAYDRAGNAGAEKFLRTLRANATIVGMGFRLSTILMQAAGYSNSFERVGAKWVAKRIKDVANPAAYEFVLSKSAEVAGRMDNLDRDIRDNVKSAMGKTDWLTAPKRFAFHGIAYMDRLVVIPTWLGAYDKAIAEGMADEDAVYAADKAVRQSQGSGAAKDLAAIQSGRGPAGEALKLMTMFYSYMSAFYQRQRSLGRDVRNGSVKDMPALLARAWWLIIVPPVLAELLAGRGPDEDEDEALWAFEKMMLALVGPIPLARDIAPIALARAKDDPTFGYKFTPVSGAGQSLINVVSDVSNVIEGEETKRATRNMIEAVGYFTGLTTGQMAAAAQFLVDVGYGEQDPQDFSDWWEGLNTGKIKEE